jgi:DNA excision repair protein ERCC-4
MEKYYKYFGILIHYNDNDQFQLINDYTLGIFLKFNILGNDNILHHLMSNKLILLQIHFPRLKIFWSPNQSFAVELFNSLKDDNEEPDEEVCQKIGNEDTEEEFFENSIEILKRLPGNNLMLLIKGVNEQNYKKIIENVDSLADLVDISFSNLTKLIGKENSCLLYDFINQEMFN